MSITAEQHKALRQPFPKEAIGKLPKGGVQLDYVGHAAVTDRLLSVDTSWTWEPVAFDANGLPAFDDQGGLWIRLTVAGVTRLGYGHPDMSKGGDRAKAAISDALRNAAMRFGVALDLWAKEDLSHTTREAATDEQVAQLLAEIESSMNAAVLNSIAARIRALLLDDKQTKLLRDAFALQNDRIATAAQDKTHG